jgi:hypothetical protein
METKMIWTGRLQRLEANGLILEIRANFYIFMSTYEFGNDEFSSCMGRRVII